MREGAAVNGTPTSAVTVRPIMRDLVGYFLSHNWGLMRAMVENPEIARMCRSLCEGMQNWAWDRGIAFDRVTFEGFTVREGAVLLRLREKRIDEL